jgi:IQ domain-containing protein G
VQRRSELKGLHQKDELKQTRTNLFDVAKKLKESTKTLCRVLKDNPDLDGTAKI